MRIIIGVLIIVCLASCSDSSPDVDAVKEALVEIEKVHIDELPSLEVLELPEVLNNYHQPVTESNVVTISEELGRLAERLHRNVIISDQISGSMRLPRQSLPAKTLWDYVLKTQHLSEMKIDEAYYIGTIQEIQSYASESSPVTSLPWHKVALSNRGVKDFFTLLQESQLFAADNHCVFDEVSNVLWFQSDKALALDITQLAQQFDQVISQIQIEARVLFVDQDYEHELGLNFHSGVEVGEGDGQIDPAAVATSGANVLHLLDSDMVDIELAALEKDGHGEVISRPSLLTVNRQPAFVQAGEEVPYQETSGGGASTVRFKKAVLSLEVTPVLRSNGQILLDIQVTQDKPSSQSVLGVPAINTRAIKTKAVVPDGQTVVLGGIYETVVGEGVRAVPGLSQLPLVGNLFKYKRKVRNKRELLIFITPVIVKQNNEKSE